MKKLKLNTMKSATHYCRLSDGRRLSIARNMETGEVSSIIFDPAKPGELPLSLTVVNGLPEYKPNGILEIPKFKNRREVIRLICQWADRNNLHFIKI